MSPTTVIAVLLLLFPLASAIHVILSVALSKKLVTLNKLSPSVIVTLKTFAVSCNSKSVATIVKLYVVSDVNPIIVPLNNPPLLNDTPLGKLLPGSNEYAIVESDVAISCI